MNLGTSLHWVSKKMKDKACLIENDTSVSYSELWDNIELLAKAFLKAGIKKNDKIIIILPNCKEFIYSFYALARINAVTVPISHYLTPRELKEIFSDCSPKGIITTSKMFENIPAGFIKELIILIDDEKSKPIENSYTFKELYEMGKHGTLPRFSASNDQIATINYTYRGTGEPLGAVLTHGNYHHGAIGYVRLTEIMTQQRVLLVTPISHIFTLVSCVIVPLLRGATVVIMKTFIPKHVFKAIEKHKIDFIIAVPTVYISLLKNYKKDSLDISSLKHGITGGSYLPPAIYERIKNEMGIELLQGYGLTETMPIACNPRSKNKPESLGVPGHEVKVKIIDDEIVIGGPTVMKEYYQKNGENKKFFKDGWFCTGDYGRTDDEGYIYFKGLKKDIVKIGGHNVDLKEVRAVMNSFEGVKHVKLNIKDNDLWGHQILAEIETDGTRKITEKEIRSLCSSTLALYKIPRKILIK